MEQTIHANKDFRVFLQEELIRRCKANPRYSLRAFARTLHADSSFLSKLLRKKRPVTRETIQRFSDRLGISPETIKNFHTNVVDDENSKFNQVLMDQFQMIVDWYHYAILELLRIRGFQGDEKSVAQSLSISITEARSALERLERLDFVKKSRNGKWRNCSGSHTTIAFPSSTAALRKHQKQILQNAILALEETPIELRDHSAMVMAFNPSDLLSARKKIKEFRREFSGALEKTGTSAEVYQLCVAFYPISKIQRREK